jgi:hypothetical protein
MAGMSNIIARIDALLANTPQSEIEEFEVTRCLRDCRDEIIAARACAEMMLQGTGQRLAESMAERVINGQTVGAWIPVSERLPEEYETVLVATDGSVSAGEIRLPDSECGMDGPWWMVFKDKRDRSAAWAGLVALNDVTHWMPLPPEPPEAK